jgi:hypothetical protein
MLLVNLGIAIWLGFADIVNTYTVARLGERKSYHAVFWLEVACAAVALVIFVLFVRLDNARSEMTVDEREEMEREEMEREEVEREDGGLGERDVVAGEAKGKEEEASQVGRTVT